MSFDLPDDLEGGITQLAAALKVASNAPDILARDAVVFALRRIMEGMPLENSLLDSLERDWVLKRHIKDRLSHSIMIAEKCIADSNALNSVVQSLISDLVSGGAKNTTHGVKNAAGAGE